MGSNAFMQLILAGSIQQLLSAMRTIQIISHMMLINVATPSNAQIFFGSMLNFVTMDLLPDITTFTIKKFNMDDSGPINFHFEEFGYRSKLSFVNYGSSTFIFLLIPVLALVAKILTKLNLGAASRRADAFY